MIVVVSAVGAKMGGALSHLRQLTVSLDALGTDRRFLVLVNDEVAATFPKLSGSVTVLPVRPMSTPHRLLWDQVLLPRLCRDLNADILLSLLNFGPRYPTCAQVVMQRNLLYFLPDAPQTGLAGRVDRCIRRRMALTACRGSQRVITPSDEMRACVAGYLGGRRPISVLPHAVDTDFFYPDEQHLSALPTKVPRDAWPRLAYVSHPAAHKGHAELMKAFAGIRRIFPSACLALTFDEHENPAHGDLARVRELKGSTAAVDGVALTGRLGREQVRALYQWADIAVFPTRRESFGFPLLEAMAMATPTVASDLPCLRELGGDAALYHGVGESGELSLLIEGLANDDEKRKTLAARGRARAVEHGMESYVVRLLDILDG